LRQPVSEVKEILVQFYAYTGFPRSLNALGELMKAVEARKQRRELLDSAGKYACAGRNSTFLRSNFEVLRKCGCRSSRRL